MIFNIRSLNKVNQLPELTASAAEHNTDIICIQQHRYYHSELKINYDPSNGWTFVSVSAWKNSVNAVIGGVGMLCSPSALKSQNSIQLQIMYISFNGNPSTTTMFCYSLTNAGNEMNIITFFNELYSLVWHISKHKVLIIGGDTNTHIGKTGITISSYTTYQTEMKVM